MTPPILWQMLALTLQAPASDWEGRFDQLEVWKSLLGQGGPYVELTSSDWEVPTFPMDLIGQTPPTDTVTGQAVPISGLTLELLLNGKTPVVVSFTGSNPLTFAAAATQAQTQSNGLLQAFVWTDGRFVLRGTSPGIGSVLHVTGGDAAPLLGLPTTLPYSYAYGRNPRVALVPGQSAYEFVDPHGSRQIFYKTRYRQASTGNVSAFSNAFFAGQPARVAQDKLILGTIDLVDASGKPVHNREILVYSRFGGSVVGGAGVVPLDLRRLTDNAGHAEFNLLRGAKLQLAVAGTQLTRDIVVPTDPALTQFNLLDPGVGSDDVFQVQVPDVDFVVRRGL